MYYAALLQYNFITICIIHTYKHTSQNSKYSSSHCPSTELLNQLHVKSRVLPLFPFFNNLRNKNRHYFLKYS